MIKWTNSDIMHDEFDKVFEINKHGLFNCHKNNYIIKFKYFMPYRVTFGLF